jgi:hypothetical protein
MANIIGDIKSGLVIVQAILFLPSCKWIELKNRMFLEGAVGNKSSEAE